MRVYWRERKQGQRLVLAAEDGEELEVGGVREGAKSIDAFAKTLGYEPGRAQRGFSSVEQAKAFVESFRPWELYAEGEGLEVEPEVRPLADAGAPAESDPEEQAEPRREEQTPSMAEEVTRQPTARRWWQFWRRG